MTGACGDERSGLLEGLPFTTPETAASADAALMRTCLRFAEGEMRSWYRYVTAPEDLADAQDNTPMDYRALDWIAATPAVSAAGWMAKALACTAINRSLYDGIEVGDAGDPVMASLLRDMARPARAEILARLAQDYGPLPCTYDEDGRWTG